MGGLVPVIPAKERRPVLRYGAGIQESLIPKILLILESCPDSDSAFATALKKLDLLPF